MNCAVCDGKNLEHVIDLPNFPLTGIFLDTPGPPQTHDQGFMLCPDCGHGQLREFLPPETLYGPDYWHRSSKSPIATAGNDFFLRFLDTFIDGRAHNGECFDFIVEIGCNDLYMLKKLKPWGKRRVGIDPIWKDSMFDPGAWCQTIGQFIEDVDYGDLGGKPDLVISSHTFEHLKDPRTELERLMESATDDALFVFEVPSLDSLLRNYRFDQVFHQHTQYFSLSSFKRMISEVGGEYLSHTFNYDYWGGTMLVAFRKDHTNRQYKPDHKPIIVDDVIVSHRLFRDSMFNLMHVIEDLGSEPIYGYGAAQMVPTLAYHLGSDLSFLECIYDDDFLRADLMYPGLDVATKLTPTDLSLQGSTVLVTAPDSLRPILQRVIPMKPRNILVPLNIM